MNGDGVGTPSGVTAARRVLLTTEYEPEYGIRTADGKLLDLCDGSYIVTFQDDLLALSADRQQKLSLHLIAANAGVPVKVLEHPTLELFVRTIEKEQFDDIGFSTIVPSLDKVEEMIQVCRRRSPASRIIIGGHGVEHEKCRTIGADIVCRGDGISFMQQLLGTEADSFRHPLLPYRHTLKALRGIPGVHKFASEGLMILCGAGCPMGCEYCPATSFYDRKRFSFLDGPALVETVFRFREQFPRAHFFLWDQDFLMDKERVMCLGEAVRSHNRECTSGEDVITWSAQSSIKAISRFHPDELFDYGCRMLSVGVESSEARWEKRKGKQPDELFKELHERGIGTFAFFIIGWEDHDCERISHEVDYLLSLNPTVNHFTLLTPEPGTAYYHDLKAQGRLLDAPPRCFNYATLQFKPPRITAAEAKIAITGAYKTGTQRLGATILRVLKLKLQGFRYSMNRLGRDSAVALSFGKEVRGLLPLLHLLPLFYPRGESRRLAKEVAREAAQMGFKMGPATWMKSLALNAVLGYRNILWQLHGVPLARWQPAEYEYGDASDPRDATELAAAPHVVIPSATRRRHPVHVPKIARKLPS